MSGGSPEGFTHFDAEGRAIMVDVSEKEETDREAEARGEIRVSLPVFEAVRDGTSKKGDVLGAARIAGIMAAKKTSELIPLCHLLPLNSCRIEFECRGPEAAAGDGEGDAEALRAVIRASCTVKNHGRTGVEMEALTGVSVALLTIYDMCKAIDRHMVIGEIRLVRKSGGRSGVFCP